MFKRVLIANRGEIALRILRACHVLGVETVAVYTDVDRNLPHLSLANVQIKVSSYLNIGDVVMAGRTTSCEAVHPGYGLLSENAEFAAKVEESGMVFIGPTAEHIQTLGDKVQARQVMGNLGVPTIPGSEGLISSVDEIRQVAEKVGYPLVVKAAFGGGGRGIRAVANDEELEQVLAVSQSEAGISFGREEVFVEKLLLDARHVELQLLGDGAGNCVHLGSRDCSVQRRYQKLVEEAPAPNISAQKLEALLDKCQAALATLCYRNAATMEFLYSGGEFYFLEVNTRLQVEHPVTELVTSQDVVSLQLKTASEERLPLEQADVTIEGCAIECRVLAEDADERPSPGRVTGLSLPGGPGIRVDSHLFVGYVVPHQYDSLIAKLVVSGPDRPTAVARMRQALAETKIEGISTNIAKLQTIVSSPEFARVTFHTNWKPE